METARNQIHVGLEIGTSKITVCVSEEMRDGALRILGIGEAPSRGVRKGEIVDPVAAAECIRMAITKAEASIGIEIEKVSVAISGSHLKSFTSNAELIVRKDQFEKNPWKYLDAVIAMARQVTLPSDQLLLQAIDGSNSGGDFCSERDYEGFHEVGSCEPNELSDNQKSSIGADCHIIHGKRSHIQRTLDCLESLQLEIVNLVPSSLAFDTGPIPERKMPPTYLVIDLGGGTSDYIKIWAHIILNSGALAVGGDHITNDISIGLRLPIAQAECLKIQEGSAKISDQSVRETFILKGDQGIPDYEIDRMSLDAIILLRVRELFEQIRDETFNYDINNIEEGDIDRVTEVVLTGGVSALQGIAELAAQVFKVPAKLGHACNVSGSKKIIKNPAYTTAIGITKFAMEATPTSSVPCERTNRIIEEPKLPKEFRSNDEYLSALRRERDSGKNLSREGSEDLDVPTYLRKGTDGMEIKHAKKL